MHKILLLVIFVTLFASSIQKSVSVTCSATCKTVSACSAVCLTYTATNLTAQYCLNASITGGAAILTCPVGLPLNLQITGCPSGNVPNCTTGPGCCLQFSTNNQCFSALTPEVSVVCALNPGTTKSVCETCQSTPTCVSKLCNRMFLNGAFVKETCIANSSYCGVGQYTFQTCSTTSCAGGCCGTGYALEGICNNAYQFNSFGVIGKQLCAWGFEETMIKYLSIALALTLMLLI